MNAMVLEQIGDLGTCPTPLQSRSIPDPVPGPEEIVIKVLACGVCHTELDEIEGRTTPPRLPVVPGHQVVGRVAAMGENVSMHRTGDRVGVGWFFSACGQCEYCNAGMENLCAGFVATGRDVNGGYAEYMAVPQTSAFRIPDLFSHEQAAPLLCAGAIGYRSLRLTGIENGANIGLAGFGSSAQLVLEMVRYKFDQSRVFVFARNKKERQLARDMGAVWAGRIKDRAPKELQAVIDTTPAWEPVKQSLENLAPAGRLVINAIRKEAVDQAVLADLNYETHLWQEKEIKSVANVARKDVTEFLALAEKIPILPAVECYDLKEANAALTALREKNVKAAKVLKIALD